MIYSGSVGLCICLPNEHYRITKAGVGFSYEVDEQLLRAANLTSCEEWQTYVVLLLDEMHIREDLVYSKSTGKLVGFSNLGEINNLLLSFERSLESDSSEYPPLANSMMVFMVRGLFTPFRYRSTLHVLN